MSLNCPLQKTMLSLDYNYCEKTSQIHHDGSKSVNWDQYVAVPNMSIFSWLEKLNISYWIGLSFILGRQFCFSFSHVVSEIHFPVSSLLSVGKPWDDAFVFRWPWWSSVSYDMLMCGRSEKVILSTTGDFFLFGLISTLFICLTYFLLKWIWRLKRALSQVEIRCPCLSMSVFLCMRLFGTSMSVRKRGASDKERIMSISKTGTKCNSSE